MKWVRVTLLALALAGCADSGIFDREKPVELVTPTEQTLPPPKLARLKAQAAAAGKSLSEYLLDEVTRIAARPALSELWQRIKSRESVNVPEGFWAEGIRAEREERERGVEP